MEMGEKPVSLLPPLNMSFAAIQAAVYVLTFSFSTSAIGVGNIMSLMQFRKKKIRNIIPGERGGKGVSSSKAVLIH